MMRYVENVSSGNKDKGNEMCVYCQNQEIQHGKIKL